MSGTATYFGTTPTGVYIWPCAVVPVTSNSDKSHSLIEPSAPPDIRL